MSNHASSCVWRTLSLARMLYEWLCFSVLDSTVVQHEELTNSLRRQLVFETQDLNIDQDTKVATAGVIFDKKERATTQTWGFPRWLNGKDSACQCRSHKRGGFNPWVRKIPLQMANHSSILT